MKRKQEKIAKLEAKLKKLKSEVAELKDKEPEWIAAIRQCNGWDANSNLRHAVETDNPIALEGWPIQWAATCGHIALVRALLADKRVDPTNNKNLAIRFAAEYGQTRVVELLLSAPRVDPTACDNYAVRYAALNGHETTVRTLLADARVDPTTRNNAAVRWAAVHGCDTIVNLLLADRRTSLTGVLRDAFHPDTRCDTLLKMLIRPEFHAFISKD